MVYATQEDFSLHCPQQTVEPKTLDALLQRASDQVDAACFGRIRRQGFHSLASYQQDCIKKAVCLQAAFLHTYGEALDSPLSSYGINGVSMAFDPSRMVRQGGVTMGQEIYSMLIRTGLAHRGIW